jgi:hypothetical protein
MFYAKIVSNLSSSLGNSTRLLYLSFPVRHWYVCLSTKLCHREYRNQNHGSLKIIKVDVLLAEK